MQLKIINIHHYSSIYTKKTATRKDCCFLSMGYEKDGFAFLIDGFEPLNAHRVIDYEIYVHLLIDAFKLSKSFLSSGSDIGF